MSMYAASTNDKKPRVMTAKQSFTHKNSMSVNKATNYINFLPPLSKASGPHLAPS